MLLAAVEHEHQLSHFTRGLPLSIQPGGNVAHGFALMLIFACVSLPNHLALCSIDVIVARPFSG